MTDSDPGVITERVNNGRSPYTFRGLKSHLLCSLLQTAAWITTIVPMLGRCPAGHVGCESRRHSSHATTLAGWSLLLRLSACQLPY